MKSRKLFLSAIQTKPMRMIVSLLLSFKIIGRKLRRILHGRKLRRISAHEFREFFARGNFNNSINEIICFIPKERENRAKDSKPIKETSWRLSKRPHEDKKIFLHSSFHWNGRFLWQAGVRVFWSVWGKITIESLER